MKVLFDSNVLIAALVESHPQNSKSVSWLIKVKQKKIKGYICIHSINGFTKFNFI